MVRNRSFTGPALLVLSLLIASAVPPALAALRERASTPPEAFLPAAAPEAPHLFSRPLTLSPAARDYLKSRPVIKVGVPVRRPPYSQKDDHGHARGLYPAFLEALNRRLGGVLHVVPLWDFSVSGDEIMPKGPDGPVDAVMGLPESIPARALRSLPFFHSSVSLVGRANAGPPPGEAVPARCRVVLLDDDPRGQSPILLRAGVCFAPTAAAALRMVAEGRADYFLGDDAQARYALAARTDLSVAVQSQMRKNSHVFGVDPDQPLLHQVLDEALLSLSHHEREQIEERWQSGNFNRLSLNDADAAWLAAHPVVRTAVLRDWLPYETISIRNEHQGVAGEYINWLEESLRIRFQPQRAASPREAERALATGRVDILPCIAWSEERAARMLLTRPYLRAPLVVAARDSGPILNNLSDLKGKRVVVVTGFPSETILRAEYPEIILVPADSSRLALKLVESSQADAYLGALDTIATLLHTGEYPGVVIAASTPYALDLCMGVRKDWPELAAILDKTLDAMPPERARAFYEQWARARTAEVVDWITFRRALAVALLFMGLVVFIVIRGNRRLRAEMHKRHKADQALNTVLMNLPGALSMCDKEMRFQLVNQKFTDIYGLDAGFVMGKSLVEAYKAARVTPERLERARALEKKIRDGMKAGRPISLEHAGPKGDVTLHYVTTHLPLADRKGKAYALISLTIDITDIKRLEAQLEQARQDAERASQAKSEFLANMSHEIRTPMNAILGLCHLAAQTDMTERQRGYLDKIDGSARTLLGLINDILDFTKIEAGKLDLEDADFSLGEALKAVETTLLLEASQKGLKTSFHIAPDVPRRLRGDSLRLTQILLNLVNNAVKFTEHGEIRVSIEVAARTNESTRLRFAVRDTGIGMDAAQAARIFDSFTQADSSTTRKYGGTGLGLAICKRLVQAMRGEIGVESEVGRGSLFHFTALFGVAQSPAGEDPHPTDQAGQGSDAEAARVLRGKRVLLAEDNEINQLVAEELLRGMGLEVDIASTGAQALDLARAQCYDVILMDIQMPEMDGLTAAQALRADLGLTSVPIIAMTAHAMSGDREKSLAAGMVEHLTKPIDPPLLRAALLRHLGDAARLCA